MSVFAPSPYQQRIFDWIYTGAGSAIVKAVAGSGKTTTIIKGLQYIPEFQSVQLVAFNTDIVGEMKLKVDKLKEELGREFRGVSVKTFHSLGNGAVAKKLKGKKLKIDGSKVVKIAEEFLPPVEYDIYGDFSAKLVGLAKGQGIGALVPDIEDYWWQLVRHHDLYLDADGASEAVAVETARRLLRLSNEEALDGSIDFDDMLYLPLLWKLRLWQNDWVIIDEAQDTNPARRALAKLALKPGGRLMAVGDAKQAIYGFMGASHDALDLIAHEFRCIELPLTVSYRCGKSIVAKAKQIVPYFEPFEGSPDGAAEHLSIAQALGRLKPTDAILCRLTAPLLSLAFDLIRSGTPCRVLGREIGSGLVRLIEQRKAKGVDGLIEKLMAYEDREVAKFQARGDEGKAQAVQDRVACVIGVIANLDDNNRTIPALIEKIKGLFEDHQSGILTLSTIHKSKGKEWDRVAILGPELMPSPWARQDWQYEQERNLMYVAWTRAKIHLIELTDAKLVRGDPVAVSAGVSVASAKAEPVVSAPQSVDDGLDLPAFLDRRPKPATAQGGESLAREALHEGATV